MALGFQFVGAKRVVFVDGGQQAFFVGQLFFWVVAAFDIGSQETFKQNARSARRKQRSTAFDVNTNALLFGVRHLTSDRAFPNQLEHAKLIAIQFAFDRLGNTKRSSCWADRFVSLLRVLDLALIRANVRMKKLFAVLTANQITCGRNRFFAQDRTVGTHVSDVTVLVQLLGRTHRSPGGKTKFTVRVLL